MDITALGPEQLDELEPLWLELLAHHRAVEPEMVVRPADDSWPLRRAAYRHWLDEGGFGLVARDGRGVAGYALVSLDGPDETWDLGPRTAELQTLVVRPDLRGEGAGSALVRAVDAELAARGLDDLLVGVVAANADALRFYGRFGWQPRYVLLHRHLPTGAGSGGGAAPLPARA